MICQPCQESRHRMCEGGDCACPRRHVEGCNVHLALSRDEAQRIVELIEQTIAEDEFDKRTLPTWRRLIEKIEREL